MPRSKSKRTRTAKRSPAPAMLHIGSTPTTLADMAAALLSVLNCTNAGDAPKVMACKALREAGQIRNVAISGCSFRSGDS